MITTKQILQSMTVKRFKPHIRNGKIVWRDYKREVKDGVNRFEMKELKDQIKFCKICPPRYGSKPPHKPESE